MYLYRTAGGKATLNRGDDSPIKKLGEYKTEKEALDACKKHYAKACKAAANLGKQIPPAHYG